jgi:hypothetical protein
MIPVLTVKKTETANKNKENRNRTTDIFERM